MVLRQREEASEDGTCMKNTGPEIPGRCSEGKRIKNLQRPFYIRTLEVCNVSKGTTFHTLRREQKSRKHNMRCLFPLFFA